MTSSPTHNRSEGQGKRIKRELIQSTSPTRSSEIEQMQYYGRARVNSTDGISSNCLLFFIRLRNLFVRKERPSNALESVYAHDRLLYGEV
jgi:hypothetical protein